MIKKLQRKFVMITMISLLAVLLLVVGGINGLNIYQITGKSDILLEMLAENGGSFPKQWDKGSHPPGMTEETVPKDAEETVPKDAEETMPKDAEETMPKDAEETVPKDPEGQTGEGRKQEEAFAEPQDKGIRGRGGLFGYRMSEETPFETRYFSVTIPAAKAGSENAADVSQMQIDLTHVAAVTEEEAASFAGEVLKKGREKGYCGQYKYQKTVKEDGQTLLVFVDCGNDLQSIRNFAVISLIVAFFCLVLVLFLVSVLSGRAIRPVIESMEKQRQFITDAGHEIKTPIAIILANAEVIEMCEGESEWTRSIRNQVERLGELVRNLLTLSRLDEMQDRLQTADFSCSETVRESVDAFAPMAQAKGLKMGKNIPEGLHMNGCEANIRRLVTILMDNAVKYSPEEGSVRVSLEKKERYLELSVCNDCQEIPEGDLNRLFDRFYRADSSRSRETGGYGIGLSVAQAIVKAHKGKITARAEDRGICFTAKLPVNEKKNMTLK